MDYIVDFMNQGILVLAGMEIVRCRSSAEAAARRGCFLTAWAARLMARSVAGPKKGSWDLFAKRCRQICSYLGVGTCVME